MLETTLTVIAKQNFESVFENRLLSLEPYVVNVDSVLDFFI